MHILNSLRNNKFICYEPFNSFVICDSCVLCKQVKFPFSDSQTTTLMPFNILHSDIWTSLILNFIGHKYYVLFWDDFYKFHVEHFLLAENLKYLKRSSHS